jgi:hypothetical protein
MLVCATQHLDAGLTGSAPSQFGTGKPRFLALDPTQAYLPPTESLWIHMAYKIESRQLPTIPEKSKIKSMTLLEKDKIHDRSALV